MLRRPAVIALSIVTGVALELGVHLASGRREAWDSPFVAAAFVGSRLRRS
jgi:hypothetical protein